jgi:hypothetical protein
MELAQALIVYVEWIFFTAWGMILAAVSVVAFGRDILPIAQRQATEKDNP